MNIWSNSFTVCYTLNEVIISILMNISATCIAFNQIIAKNLKDFKIINPCEIHVSKFEENVHEWPLIENGAIINYSLRRVRQRKK